MGAQWVAALRHSKLAQEASLAIRGASAELELVMLRKRNHELEEQVAAGKRRRLQDSKLDKASIEASVQSVHFMESAKEAALRSIDLQQAKLLDDIEDVAVPDVVE